MSLSVNIFMPSKLNDMIEAQKKSSKTFSIHDNKEDLLEAFRQAKDEYIDKILRGLNAYSEQDLKEKLQDWIKFNYPGDDATPEQLETFFKEMSEFAVKLQELAASQGNKELLITTGDKEDEDMQKFLQSRLPSNFALKSRLLESNA